jgi:hypothetical protein
MSIYKLAHPRSVAGNLFRPWYSKSECGFSRISAEL